VVLNISEAQGDYAQQLARALKQAGIRAAADLRNEKIGYKIREHTLQKVPYLLIVGEREMTEGCVTCANRPEDNKVGSIGRPFEGIEMKIEKAGEGRYSVRPPSFRVDIEREIDLVEEIARLWGFDRVPVTMPCAASYARCSCRWITGVS